MDIKFKTKTTIEQTVTLEIQELEDLIIDHIKRKLGLLDYECDLEWNTYELPTDAVLTFTKIEDKEEFQFDPDEKK